VTPQLVEQRTEYAIGAGCDQRVVALPDKLDALAVIRS
jgi:hypothetical protein